MSKTLSQIMEKVKSENTREAKTKFVRALVEESFLVPIIARTKKDESGKDCITDISHFSVSTEENSYLMVFTSVAEISKWRSDIQFVELGFDDVLSLVEKKSAGYTGIIIDHSGTNLAVSKNILEKLKNDVDKSGTM